MPVTITRRGRVLVATAPIVPALPAEGENAYVAQYSATPPAEMTAEAYVAMIEREVGIMTAHLLAERADAVESAPAKAMTRAELVAGIAAAMPAKETPTK